MSEKAIEVLTGGPFSLKEIAFERFEEFFQSVLDQAALTPEQQTALGDTLRGTIEKRDSLGSCIAWIEAQAEAIGKEEKRLAARRRNFEKFHDAVCDSLHTQMKEWGVRKVEGLQFSFAVKKNPPSVKITDEALIPAEYWDYTPTLQKAAIKDALEEKKEVPGAELDESRTRLEIK
jgi:hypothetical protein